MDYISSKIIKDYTCSEIIKDYTLVTDVIKEKSSMYTIYKIDINIDMHELFNISMKVNPQPYQISLSLQLINAVFPGV